MTEVIDEVRCMLIPLREGRLLLPSACVAEVIGYRTPDPVEGQPTWMQGTVNWHQRDIPVVDYEGVLGRALIGAGIRQRIAVCYAIGVNPQWPLFGIVAQGIPRLLRVSEEAIQSATGEKTGGRATRMKVTVAGESLIVPDLEFLQANLPGA